MTLGALTSGYMESLIKGVELRNSGSLEEAEKYLIQAAMLSRDEWQPYFELGILFADRQNPGMANKLFEQAFSKKPNEKEVIQKLLSSSVATRDVAGFSRILEKAQIQDEDSQKLLASYYQLMQFTNAYTPQDAGQIHNKLVESSRGWLLITEVVAEFKHAQQNNLPYAFIRLGDGEGTWLHHDSVEEVHFNALYTRNRDEFWGIWYGHDRSKYRNAFYAQMSALSRRLVEADLIGIPPIAWINHEYSIGSIRGIPGTLNALRMLERSISSGNALCTQLLHFELSESAEFFEFLSSLENISVISCHPEIQEIMRLKLGIEDITYIPIPGEPSRSALLGENSIRGEHFPSAFLETLERIKEINWTGKVCLVGAGILGKQYCLEIKRLGGIAIDVGSIMDKWNNKKTRPDF